MVLPDETNILVQAICRYCECNWYWN